MTMVVKRDGELVTLHVTPSLVEENDRLGNAIEIGQLGIRGSGAEYVQRDPISAVGAGCRRDLEPVGRRRCRRCGR